MLQICCTPQGNYPVLICDWCHEPLLEDSQGIYMWQTPTHRPTIVDMVCIHFHCTLAYEQAHHIIRSSWSWEPLSHFSSKLQLESRQALHNIHVLVKATNIDEEFGFRPERSDKYVTILSTPSSVNALHTLTLDGGFVTFDLDAQKKLIGVEISYAREGWSVVSTMDIPPFTGTHDIYFIDILHDHERIEETDNLHCVTDASQQWLFLTIAPINNSAVWVSLSSQCSALIEQGCLKGLFVWLQALPEVS